MASSCPCGDGMKRFPVGYIQNIFDCRFVIVDFQLEVVKDDWFQKPDREGGHLSRIDSYD
jgi:hypothetical protein